MMRQIGWGTAFILSIFGGWGCKEVFQRSLDKVNIVLVAPGNHVVSADSAQNLYWQPVDTNVNYEVEVVTPRFDSVVSLVVDTTLTGNVFVLTLMAGQYQWKVRAFNTVSTTVFSEPWTFTIN